MDKNMTRLLGFTPKNGNRSGDTLPMYHDGKWHIFILDPTPGRWLMPVALKTRVFHIVSEDLAMFFCCNAQKAINHLLQRYWLNRHHVKSY